MKTLFIAFFCITSIAHSQEFVYDINGLNDYLVLNFEDKNTSELYTRTKEWVLDTYQNPEEVIKVDLSNDKIRISGVRPNVICIGMFCSTFKYQIEISFKDNKIKFDPITLISINSDGVSSEIPLDNGEVYFRKNGKPRTYGEKTMRDIELTFNELAGSLSSKIKSNDSNDDW